MSLDEKRDEISDTGNNLVKKSSDMDPYDADLSVLRAVLSCGLDTGPQTLTDSCRTGKVELKFKREWSYTEVLTPEEQQHFEERLANNNTRKTTDIKNGLGSDWLIERSDSPNDDVSNAVLDLLRDCENITLADAANIDCPAFRACPTCGLLINHSTKNCKSVTCSRCHMVFCFVCLKLKSECGKTSHYYKLCSSGLAPRQTSIPLWRDK